MAHSIKIFIFGMFCTILVVFIGLYTTGSDALKFANQANTDTIAVTPNTVVIESMPTFRTLSGINVPFRGKANLQQVIVGRYAKNIIITYFKVTGENAHKSVIEIIWEDGSVDLIPAGTVERHFPLEKRAKQIVIHAYSNHERRVFRDSSRPGVLDWEIIYNSTED